MNILKLCYLLIIVLTKDTIWDTIWSLEISKAATTWRFIIIRIFTNLLSSRLLK